MYEATISFDTLPMVAMKKLGLHRWTPYNNFYVFGYNLNHSLAGVPFNDLTTFEGAMSG